jgi:hypothetical protein
MTPELLKTEADNCDAQSGLSPAPLLGHGQQRVLPTKYNGVLFRSRTEARWAAYFDMIGLEWQYEPEGYALDCGNYCPDFYCPEPYDFFVEVKPNRAAMEEKKLRALAKMTRKKVFCVVGAPSTKAQWACDENGDDICWGIFCNYAFTDKGWTDPYYGDTDCFDDEPYHHQAANMRFENGVA